MPEKSSLLNALARREAAIVSPIAGTTRDMIDVHLNLGGYAAILTDTAGLRRPSDGIIPVADDHAQIEAEGIRRALERSKDAHLKIFLYDGTLPIDESFADMMDANTLCVANKMDCDSFRKSEESHIAISARDGRNVENLLAAILTQIRRRLGQGDAVDSDHAAIPSLTRSRHREALTNAAEYITRGMSAPLPELAAEDLRLALRNLGSLTGRVDIEDLLDMIFRDFCIGK
jgi:tRNA modification GTPase